MGKVITAPLLLIYGLLAAVPARAQNVSATTSFDQTINSPPWLVCTGNASVEYSGGVLMRAEVEIVDSQGHLKAEACNPSCLSWDYTPTSNITVEVRYQVDLDNDPSGNWYCVLDGTAELDYTYFVPFSAGSAQTIEPRVPKDLKKSTNVADQYTYTSPGNYLRVRTWQVWDNYDLPWTYGNFPVTETYEYGQNDCNIQIATDSGYTQPDGTFPDSYGNFDGAHTIRQCITQPSCTTQTTQKITVAGTLFSHGVTWGCSDVQISRQ